MATDLIARGLAAKTWAAARANTSIINVSSYYLPEHGANLRPAYQAAINAAAAINGRVVNDYGAVTQQIWEKAFDTPNTFDVASINRNRTLTIPACSSIDIDFAGANIVLKGPTGGDRFASGGQTVPGIATAGFGFATWNGKWLPGFLIVLGVIKSLRIANVDVDGGFTGDTVNQDNVILFDKGFLCQDLGDANLGVGVGTGRVAMDNVVMHGFAGEIMYDNSARELISRDCHFYNSGHSCWNPNGIGKVTAYNLQAGISRQPAEVLGGKGHTYFGGRFYKAGGAGSTFIGGPDPTFGAQYNDPVRRTDAPPPYVTFINTRFEDFPVGFLYLGSYMRGSIIATDVTLFLATGFASGFTYKDVDLDVYATVDRVGGGSVVQVAGPATNDGTQPRNVNVRVHASRTALAVTNSTNRDKILALSGLIDPSCTFSVDGIGKKAFEAAPVAGTVLPFIDSTGFNQISVGDFLYFAANQTFTIASAKVQLFPTAAGTFDFILDTAPGYTDGQLFTFGHDGSGSADRIVSFAQNGSGMRLNATRTLRRAGEYLTLRRSDSGAVWVEHAYMGQGA